MALGGARQAKHKARPALNRRRSLVCHPVFAMNELSSVDVIRSSLGRRSIVLVGLMGCGKSSIGKRLAGKLALPFVDADEEIERVAAKSISEISQIMARRSFGTGNAKSSPAC